MRRPGGFLDGWDPLGGRDDRREVADTPQDHHDTEQRHDRPGIAEALAHLDAWAGHDCSVRA